MLSSGANVIKKGRNVIIWSYCYDMDMEIIVSSGANVIIWCYHAELSSGMITPPFLFFLKTSLTHLNGLYMKAKHKQSFSPKANFGETKHSNTKKEARKKAKAKRNLKESQNGTQKINCLGICGRTSLLYY